MTDSPEYRERPLWQRALPEGPDGLAYRKSHWGVWYAAEPGGFFLSVQSRIDFRVEETKVAS